jgi:hypothetical protein
MCSAPGRSIQSGATRGPLLGIGESKVAPARITWQWDAFRRVRSAKPRRFPEKVPEILQNFGGSKLQLLDTPRCNEWHVVAPFRHPSSASVPLWGA